jgi:GxxExxY protein
MQLRNLRVERQKPVPVVYKQTKLECGYRIDLLVEGRIVVELKSVDGLAPIHEAIILTYLRLSGHRLGLLINFNVSVLKDGIRRFIL